jgi:3D (Asp-Asp-Asp) domain-containing protein
MEEREQSSVLEDQRLAQRRRGPLRADHVIGFAALVATLLVALGVGTVRRSQGSAPDVAPDAALDYSSGCAPSHFVDQAVSKPFPAPTGGDGASARRAALAGVRSLSSRTLLATLIPDRFGRSVPDDRPIASSDSSYVRTYNGRPIRMVAVVRMWVTAYSPDERSCGSSADGITASGYSVLTNGGALVAADPRVLPLGSLVCVPGYDDGGVVPVLDTGGAIKGNRLDVLYPTHELAVQWGVQELDVEIWDYADGLPSGFRRVRRPAK